MGLRRMRVIVFYMLSLHVTVTYGHIITLGPGESDCLYQDFPVSFLLPGESESTVPTEVSLGFEVKKEFFGRSHVQNPVRVNCTDPHGIVLVSKDYATEEELRFYAHGTGRYTVCFSNGKPGVAPPPDKINPKAITRVDLLYFMPLHKQDDPNIILTPHGNGDRRGKLILDQDSVDTAHSIVHEMKAKARLILQEQRHMKIREARHRQTVDSTSSRSIFWAVIETLVFAGTNLLQVFIVRRFFEVRPQRKSGR